jgi:arsenite/tail-anchored protein-transporting ATPase
VLGFVIPFLQLAPVYTMLVLLFLGAAPTVEGFQLSPTSTSTIASLVPRHRQQQQNRIPPFGAAAGRTDPLSHMKSFRGALYSSLKPLIDEITVLAEQKAKQGGLPPVVFVGGKGGVGKTSVSASLAVAMASSSSFTSNLRVLVVSTDPAHSLGDALDVNLKVQPPQQSQQQQQQPIQLTDSLTMGNLFAQEIDASAAIAAFRQSLEAFDVNALADSLGVSAEMLDSFGLKEFGALLNNPPPGLDELVALVNVLDNPKVAAQFDAIIVDTAPTGHTLRLLQLPQFLDGMLGKLVKLRIKLSGLASTFQAFMGGGGAAQEQQQQRQQAVSDALGRLEAFQKQMSTLRTRFQSKDETRFVIVTIPTRLGVAESKRLWNELVSQGVSVTDIVVNQCVVDTATSGASELEEEERLNAYYRRRRSAQDKWIEKLQSAVDDVSASPEYQQNRRRRSDASASQGIQITTVPFFDVELVGIPALGFVGSQCLVNNPAFQHLFRFDDRPSGGASTSKPRVVICGGKGGVGKTTTSSSLGVAMAAAGHKVAIISTDPAHSLGDALDMPALGSNGGQLVDCSLVGVPNDTGEGSLSAMEVDPTSAIKQFKGLVDSLVGKNVGSAGASANGEGGIGNALRDLEGIFDTLPAGTDEVVALAKIVNLVRKGDYDRIVLDTAPTGHTLRMLSTPGFLAELIDRLLAIADKINSNPAVRLLLSSRMDDSLEEAAVQAKSQLLTFQLQMYELEDMFSDADLTEFLIVTVATELAARESIRLLNDLTFESPDWPIMVRNVVVNQVLTDDDEGNTRSFVSHVSKSQRASIEELERSIQASKSATGSPAPPRITMAPYLDTEPRGVYGLKVLADTLLQEQPDGAPVEAGAAA